MPAILMLAMTLLAISLFGCAPPAPVAVVPSPTPTETPCIVLAAEFEDDVDALMTRWQDAKDVTAATPRLNLAGPLADLQAIRREAEALEVPPCVRPVRATFVAYMDHVIDGVLMFMAKEDETLVNNELQLAADMLPAYDKARADLGWAAENHNP